MNNKTSRFKFLMGRALILLLILCLLPAARAEAANEDSPALKQRVQEIVSSIPVSANDPYKKALYLHDYLATHVQYAVTPNDQDAYGALVEGRAVCKGYAEAYKLLLESIGIESDVITGKATNSTGTENHAWNRVIIEGKCYYTDVTWDAPFNKTLGKQILLHKYFNLSLQEMEKDHQADKLIPLGPCGHTGKGYYDICSGPGTGIGIFGDQTTPQQAATYFKMKDQNGRNASFVCEFLFKGSDMTGWINANWQKIAENLKLTGKMNCSMAIMDNTCTLVISGDFTETVAVTSVQVTPESLQLNEKKKTAQLSVTVLPSNAFNRNVRFSSDNPKVVKVDNQGNVTALAAGSATITVTTEDGNKTAVCRVTVSIHTHDTPLRYVSPVDAGCLTEGNKAYYVCDSCGKWFWDAGAKNKIADRGEVVLRALGHTDANEDGRCDRCGAELGTDATDPTRPADPTPSGTDAPSETEEPSATEAPATVPQTTESAPTDPGSVPGESQLPDTVASEAESSIPDTEQEHTDPPVTEPGDKESGSVIPVVIIVLAVAGAAGILIYVFLRKRQK